MTTAELITTCRNSLPAALSTNLVQLFAFLPGSVEQGYPTDAHQAFRAEVVEALLPDFSLADIALIRSLFQEEMACEAAIGQHESLYQVCYYLYELGQLEDCFRLYEAKFLATSMDVGTLLDREMMTVGHSVEEVMAYVQAIFREQPQLQALYPTMLSELQALLTYSDYDNLQDYRTFVHGYFHGHNQVTAPLDEVARTSRDATEQSGYQPHPKPWWRFW